MSLVDKMHSIQDKDITKSVLRQAFGGSRLEGFDNGGAINRVIIWEEGDQSAIAYLVVGSDSIKVTDYEWAAEDRAELIFPQWEGHPEVAGFLEKCLAHVMENGIDLQDVGCKVASDARLAA